MPADPLQFKELGVGTVGYKKLGGTSAALEDRQLISTL